MKFRSESSESLDIPDSYCDAGLKERKQIKDLLDVELKTEAGADFLDTTKKAGL